MAQAIAKSRRDETHQGNHPLGAGSVLRVCWCHAHRRARTFSQNHAILRAVERNSGLLDRDRRNCRCYRPVAAVLARAHAGWRDRACCLCAVCFPGQHKPFRDGHGAGGRWPWARISYPAHGGATIADLAGLVVCRGADAKDHRYKSALKPAFAKTALSPRDWRSRWQYNAPFSQWLRCALRRCLKTAATNCLDTANCLISGASIQRIMHR